MSGSFDFSPDLHEAMPVRGVLTGDDVLAADSQRTAARVVGVVESEASSKIDEALVNSINNDSLARKEIAVYLAKGYVWLLVLILVGGMFLNAWAGQELIDVANAVSVFTGAYSGVLGFVLGYYYAKKDKT